MKNGNMSIGMLSAVVVAVLVVAGASAAQPHGSAAVKVSTNASVRVTSSMSTNITVVTSNGNAQVTVSASVSAGGSASAGSGGSSSAVSKGMSKHSKNTKASASDHGSGPGLPGISVDPAGMLPGNAGTRRGH